MRQILFLIFIKQICSQVWNLVWSDDFNGNQLDKSKWGFDIGNQNGWGNNELQYYTDTNHRISNGELIIEARKENYQGFNYTSSRLQTYSHFNFIYGKVEMRAKLPYGQGIWPAFWLLGKNINAVGWPACGEIDIMEYIGKTPTNVYGSVHGTNFHNGQTYTNIYGFTGYHTYSVEWQPWNVAFYVDGNYYGSVGCLELLNNNPMYILINLAIGGDWPGSPDWNTVFPQQYVIDYIKVYQQISQQQEE